RPCRSRGRGYFIHRRVDFHGQRSRVRAAHSGSYRLSNQRNHHRPRQRRSTNDALPSRLSGQGNRRGHTRSPCRNHLHPGRESSAHAKGNYQLVDGL
ncbi:uncharacterized protein METZ01_LOCUS466008, partial [marine metagenome]